MKLYKQDESGSIREWWAETIGDSYRLCSGLKQGKIIFSEWTKCEAKNIGKSNELSPSEQALAEVKAHYKKKQKRGYTPDLDKVRTCKEVLIKPMLAHRYEDYKDSLEFPLFAQAKLDGIRCIARPDGLWSRKGEPLNTVPHIADIITKLCRKHDVVLDGELYNHKLKDNFNLICSLVRKQTIDEKRRHEVEAVVEYHVYDIVDEHLSFQNRLKKLHSILALTKEIKIVQTRKVLTLGELDTHYEFLLAQGYEGQMIREDVKYIRKRTSALLKRKEFQDEEFIVRDIIEGKGNRSGMVGAVVFDNFQASLMGTNEYRVQVLKNKEKFIGREATVKFFHKTPDGIPRFPVVKIIKEVT